MRRNAALLALVLLVAPVAARLVAASSDLEATRCAVACARAGMAAEKGAACCPTEDGATLSSCARDADGAPLPGALGPMRLAAAPLLPPPSASRRSRLAPAPILPFPAARLLDKVPLLLG